MALSVRRVMSDRGYVLQKVVSEFDDDGRAIINILPEDTERIHIENGRETYKYDIQLTRADGTVTTIVPASNFVVEEDVTHE